MGYTQADGGGRRRAQAATPAEHLADLLARAENPFDVDGALALRLTRALMHQSELHSTCQRNIAPQRHCSTYKHIFLLADGSSSVLWELQHTATGNGQPCHEIYSDRAALLQAERRAAERMGLTPQCSPAAPEAHAPELTYELVLAVGPVPEYRAYTERNSAEHARRLLRRAENADRPGEEVLHRLRRACGHQIARVPRPGGMHRHHHVWCSVYEHAFLLYGGEEISLYELEHNLTPEGQLVCEVYPDEATADQAADRYARAHGVDL